MKYALVFYHSQDPKTKQSLWVSRKGGLKFNGEEIVLVIFSESRNDIIVSSSKKRGIFYEKETKQTSQRHTRKTCYPR